MQAARQQSGSAHKKEQRDGDASIQVPEPSVGSSGALITQQMQVVIHVRALGRVQQHELSPFDFDLSSWVHHL